MNGFQRAYEEASIVPGQPIPIRPAVPAAGEFPIEALSPLLQAAVRAVVDKVQLPVAIAAGGALAAASLAVQAYVDVAMPTGEVVPTSLFIVPVGKSGERKSSADKLLLRAVRAREAQLQEHFQTDNAGYVTAKAAYDAARSKAKTGKKGRAEIEAALNDCGDEPIAPMQPVLIVDEPTMPALHKLFAEAMPSLGLFSDEGATLIGGHAMNDENRVQSGAALSKLWDGATIRRVRASEAVSFLPGRRLALHLMIQPRVAKNLFGDKGLRDQGLLSRLLVCHPASTQGYRPWKDPDADSDLDLDKFAGRMMSLLSGAIPMDPMTRKLSPATMELSPEARTMFIPWHDSVEAELKPGGAFEEISGFAAKLPEHSLRIAAVISYFQNRAPNPISAAALSSGIKIAQFYASEAMRLFGVGGADEDTENAATLIDWIRSNDLQMVGARMLTRHGPGRSLNGPALKRAIMMLVEMKHFVQVQGGAEVTYRGKTDMQREAYTVVADVD